MKNRADPARLVEAIYPANCEVPGSKKQEANFGYLKRRHCHALLRARADSEDTVK